MFLQSFGSKFNVNSRFRMLAVVVAGLLMSPTSMMVADTTWTDVTQQFVKNAGFDNSGDDNGWTWETSTGTAGIGSGNIRFYSGSFDFHQTLTKLPKGHYRLSVQAFYRDGGNEEGWSAHQNSSESLDSWLYAGSNTKQVVSIFSQSLNYNAAGRCYTPDNKNYYPDGRDAAGLSFEAGLYWNTIEFDASGTLTIGIRCESTKGSNYCVADNFKLEYYGDLPGDLDPDEDGWINITENMLVNPDFNEGNADGWTWENTGNCNFNNGGVEFYIGTFDFWQELKGLPKGQYRLSVQAYYRAGSNSDTYQKHKNGTEDITAWLYAGNNRQKLVSVYSVEFDDNLNNNCWSPNSSSWGGWWGGTQYEPPFFPNGMSSGSAAFERDSYWNVMEFEAEGNLRIGLINTKYTNECWCMFDNFKLEFKGEIVKATSVKATIADTEIVVGQQTTATATILPENTLSKRVNWTSSDNAIATVSSDGVVTGVGTGTATITATTTDGSKLSSSVRVKVIRNSPTAESLIINEIMASNVDEFISPAFNFDGWVELYNPTNKPVNLDGLYVSNDAANLLLWKMPSTAGAIPANGFTVVWFDSNDGNGNNTPFKLDTDGGAVYFSNESGELIASQTYPTSKERISYARTTDGGDTWGQAGQATPGASNETSTFATQQLEAPVVDQPSQLFNGSLNVQVTIPQGSTLRYTTDGTLPTLENGQTSNSGRFSVNSTSIYRFRLFADDKLPSRVTSRSYIYKDRDYTLPVVSVVSDPDFFYSKEIGVFEKGPNGRAGNGQDDKCNWNMNWERPVNFSYITADGAMVLNQDVDLEMCGGWSRAWTPHSFKLKGTKEQGGVKYLPYQFFDQKPYIRNRTLQIRNGGNDNNGRIIDPAIQYIIETSGIDIDCQGYQPAHEFINGEYIGVLNVREPNNKHFVYANYGWDDDEIDQFEMSPDSGYVQKCGTPDVFNHLVDDLSPNAADPNVYAEICQLLDMDEYTNYMAAEFYLGSTDWPQNNVKGFRHVNGGKFRFVLFDIDFAFNTNDPFTTFMNKERYTFDELRPHGTGLGRITDNIRFVTLFKNLLNNDTFRKRFIDAFCLIGGSVLEASRASEIISQLKEAVSGPMDFENKGWDLNNSANKVTSNLSNRLNTAIGYLRGYSPMQLSNVTPQQVKLSSNVNGARLLVNGLDVPTGCFDGKLFAPIVLSAAAPEGYTFKGWQNASGTIVSTNAEYDISGKGTQTLTATYEPIATDQKLIDALAMPIKVNEVSAANSVYCNDYFKRNDWFELYNNTDTDLNLAGLYVSDNPSNPMKYQITDPQLQSSDIKLQTSTILPAGGHRIIWADGLTPVSQLHASFKLGNSNGQAVIVCSSDEFVNNNPEFFAKHPGLKSFVDGLTYDSHIGTQSVGRYPDGGNTIYLMNHPTIERPNTRVSTDQSIGTDRSWMELANHKFTLDLAEGWNWTSHILSNAIDRSSLSNQALRIVSATDEAYLDSRLGMTGTLKQLEAGQLYKVQMKAADTYTSTAKFCEANMPIALKPGWNWIGYPVDGAQSIGKALSGIKAENGDVILGQDGMATYTANGWTGTLSTFETGKGYMYKSVSAKTLRFAAPTVQVRMNQSRVRQASALGYSVSKYAYPNIMGVIARLQLNGENVEEERFTLLAYADDECRGEGQWVDGMVWMNVYGEGGENVTYRAIDQMDGTVYAVEETTVFASGNEGTYDSPTLLTLNGESAEPTGIASLPNASSPNAPHASSVLGYYSLGGTLVAQRAAALREGIYIVKYSDGRCRKICIK